MSDRPARPLTPSKGLLASPFPEDYPDFHSEGPAPCTEVDPDLFFPLDKDDPLNAASIGNPNTSHSIYPMSTAAVKQVCAGCPYVEQCLAWALDNSEPGIWGGTTDHDRRLIKRRNLRARN